MDHPYEEIRSVALDILAGHEKVILRQININL